MSQLSVEEIYCFARLPKNPEQFWDLNIELSYLDPFSEFSKEKGSSSIMYGIWLLCDPKSSYNNSKISEAVTKAQIAKNHFGNEKFDWSKYGTHIRAYRDYCRTKIEKSLDELKVILDERQEAMENLDWDADFDRKDKMYLSQSTYYEKYFQLLGMLNNEREEALAHGRYTPSTLEARGQSI